MAGKARVCSHIGALLWKLEMGVQLGITGISCTDKTAAWNRGTKRNVEPALLNSMSFNLKRSTVDPASTQHPRPTRKVKHFASKEKLADHIKKSPYGELFNIPSTLLHNTLMTTRREIQQPSQAPASVQRQQAAHHSERVAFQSPKCKERQLNKVEPPVDDFEITLERPLCNLNFGKLLGSERAVDKLSLTMTSAKKIEAATREQRNCAEWFSHRKGRITASLFKDVCRSKRLNCESLMKRILNDNCITSLAVQYGINYEQLAKQRALAAFQTKHTNCRLEDCGLMIHPRYPYLGCSPDGLLVCDCHPPALLEVKCLYSLRHVHPDELIKEGQCKADFCLDSAGVLKAAHKYYYQVQAQLHLNLVGSTVCYLYLHVDQGGALIPVKRDEGFMETHINNLESFFESIILPRL
ncbi:uncharacterized protein LOC144102049 isoform X1 [Amblyomma americanum]